MSEARTDLHDFLARKLSTLLILFLAAAGMIAIFYATRWGTGTSPDSVAYIGAARSLLQGDGLSVPFGESINAPMTHHAPLYPLLLALPGLFGADPVVNARWWEILLFGSNLLFAGAVLKTLFRDSLWIPVWGTFFILTANPMLEIHLMAWTEPVFILLGMAGLFILAEYLSRPRKLILAAASLLIGLAFLARYSGAALVIAGAVAIFLWGGKKWQAKLLDIAILGLISCLPIIFWMLRNLSVSGTATNRQFAFHPIGRGHLWQSLSTLSSWLLIPAGTHSLIKLIPWLALFAAGLFVFAASWRQGRYGPALPRLGETPREACFLGILVVYLIAYAVFTAASLSFFDANTPLNNRILSPIYLPVLILAMYTTREFSRRLSKSLPFQLGFIAVGLVLSSFYFLHDVSWIEQLHLQGTGYLDSTWRHSQVMAYLQTLPPGVPIFSNAPEPVYLLTGRPAYMLPRKFDTVTQQANPEYLHDLDRMEAQIEKENGVAAYIDAVQRWTLTGEDEIKASTSLVLLYSADDGAVFGTRAQAP